MSEAEPLPTDAVPEAAGAPEQLALRIAEALIFSSAEPVSPKALAEALRELGTTELAEAQRALPHLMLDAGALIAALKLRYAGSGLELVEVAGGWQFRSRAELAPYLTKVLKRPRRLPRSTMESLAIIAYHQPCTRADIEEIRGVALGQNTLDTLLEAGLITPAGKKEAPGRPTLWATTAEFLTRFGLRGLSDLPRREELLIDMPKAASADATVAQEA